MAIRIVGVDLPQNKRGEIALTYIFGIGRSSSAKILEKAGVDKDLKVKDWMLSWYPSPYWTSCTWSEYKKQCSYS